MSSDYANDVIRGARAIADYRNEPVRRTTYLLERRLLPAYKVGRVWEMRRSTHDKMVADREAAALSLIASA